MIYYVYILLNTLESDIYEYNHLIFEYKPFYIGKGKGRRVFESMKIHNDSNHEKNRILSDIYSNQKEPLYLFLETNLSEDEALLKESEYIKLIGRNNLTNLTSGGDSPYNQFGSNNPFYCKNRDDIWKDNQSNKVAGSNHGMYDKKHSEQILEKIRINSNQGKNDEWLDVWKLNNINNSKKVYQYDKGMNLINIYESVKSASELTGYSESKISKHCRGETLLPKPFYWKYDMCYKILRNSYQYKIGDEYEGYVLIKRTKNTCILKRDDLILNIRRKDDSTLWIKKKL